MLNMKRVQKGFTLIELMIVIAIVAILVALAVPAYKDYTIRTKVAECINGAAVPKLQISEFFETVGNWPADANEAGTAAPAGESQYCDSIDYVSNGIFVINTAEANIDSGINGLIDPRMVPTESGQGGVDWDCQVGNTPAGNVKYLPSTCRTANSP